MARAFRFVVGVVAAIWHIVLGRVLVTPLLVRQLVVAGVAAPRVLVVKPILLMLSLVLEGNFGLLSWVLLRLERVVVVRSLTWMLLLVVRVSGLFFRVLLMMVGVSGLFFWVLLMMIGVSGLLAWVVLLLLLTVWVVAATWSFGWARWRELVEVFSHLFVLIWIPEILIRIWGQDGLFLLLRMLWEMVLWLLRVLILSRFGWIMRLFWMLNLICLTRVRKPMGIRLWLTWVLRSLTSLMMSMLTWVLFLVRILRRSKLRTIVVLLLAAC